MTLTEARKILGLGPDEDPRPHLEEFKAVREKIADMVRMAPSELLADRYRQGLGEFDEAIEVVQEYLQALGLMPRGQEIARAEDLSKEEGARVAELAAEEKKVEEEKVEEEKVEEEKVEKKAQEKVEPEEVKAEEKKPEVVQPAEIELEDEVSKPVRGRAVFVEENLVRDASFLPAIPQAKLVSTKAEAPVVKKEEAVETAVKEEEVAAGSSSRSWLKVACGLLLVLVLASLAGWGYLVYERERELEKMELIADLERQGANFIENRRWPEATKAFDEIEKLDAGSELAAAGRRSIEAGMEEEQNQFIGYWKGEAIASFDAGRWGDAEAAARQVLDKYPGEEELLDLVAKIEVAKQEEERQMAFEGVRRQIEKRQFDEAIRAAELLIQKDSEDADAIALLERAKEAKEVAEVNLKKAEELMALALERDSGEYDEQAMIWLREAVSLAPDDQRILAKYEEMAAYTRTIRIPGDYETVTEALSVARDRDRLVIGEGIWKGPFIVTAAVELEGVSGKTIFECDADAGSVITVVAGVQGARVSGLTVRHLSFDAGEERFSLVLVRDAKVEFSDCRFEQGSGHGLMVMDGGHVKVLRSRFTENGWNGIAATGAGSLLEAEENVLKENYQNGIECWDGAAAILSKNQSLENSRNGIHVAAGSASATVLDNTLTMNREFGIVLSSAGSGQISGNKLEKNMLGGMVVKNQASGLVVKENTIRANTGPGLVLEKGLELDPFVGNQISQNTGKQLVADADFSEQTE